MTGALGPTAAQRPSPHLPAVVRASGAVRAFVTPGRARVLTVVSVAAEVVLFAVLLHVHGGHAPIWLLGWATGSWLVASTALAACRWSTRAGVVVVVGAGVLLQLVALTARPQTSDDAYRYAWDARVQLAGVDPYADPPAAAALEHLRTPELFGPHSPCTYPVPHGCTAINRPGVRTIYPPVAEAAFAAIGLASAGHGGLLPWQIAAALGVTGVTLLLARRSRQGRIPIEGAALWAWSPLVVGEYGNDAHIDWLAALLGVVAIGAAEAGHHCRAVLSLAAAVATKVHPALLLPALMRRRPALYPVGVALIVALTYLPHLLATGGAVLGYLPGYLHEEGYASGSRLLLLGAVLPRPFDTAGGALVLAAVGWWALRHGDPDDPAATGVVLVGTAFLVVTPSYGWYAGLLLALAAWSRRWEWVPVAIAPGFVYLDARDLTHPWPARLVYGGCALLAVALAVSGRRRRGRRDGQAASKEVLASPIQ